MKDLNDYFSSTSNKSKFSCNLGEKGGFINFKNSGQRGSIKEFTLSLETIISGLTDIRDNIAEFGKSSQYHEGTWRDCGSEYFSNLVLNSMITVQTKACFTTFSKIINWANDKNINDYDDNIIDLREKSLQKTIEKLEKLSVTFTPKKNNMDNFFITRNNIPLATPKPFLLLAGISGTGKTRFVREQAKATGSLNKTYCLTSVRPDWHEPSDLLGYISRLSGSAEYITTDVLQFIAKAWRAILDAGLTLATQDIAGQGQCLTVAGDRDVLPTVLPYWLCLDEMNLAPVEQYFADYLSVLETREWRWDDDAFIYLCDPLLKPATIEQVADNNTLRRSLGFTDAKYDHAWALICQHGLGIPFNLMVAGTVNMDETTHSFSRKVLDRALSIDFGEFFPNDYSQFFAPKTQPKTLSYPIWSQARPEDLAGTVDTNGQQSIAFLTAVNQVLAETPFRLAYRALNELLLTVISQNPQSELELKAVWDDFLMCKVLPRIEGDHDKLGSEPTLLESLSTLLQQQFAEFWHQETRPDLLRESLEKDDKAIAIACRSKTKLNWMQQRLANAGFTSFWP